MKIIGPCLSNRFNKRSKKITWVIQWNPANSNLFDSNNIWFSLDTIFSFICFKPSGIPSLFQSRFVSPRVWVSGVYCRNGTLLALSACSHEASPILVVCRMLLKWKCMNGQSDNLGQVLTSKGTSFFSESIDTTDSARLGHLKLFNSLDTLQS